MKFFRMFRFLSPSWKGFSFGERLSRTRDEIFWELPSILPKRLRYTTTLRALGAATKDSPNIPATALEDILRNLDAPKNFS